MMPDTYSFERGYTRQALLAAHGEGSGEGRGGSLEKRAPDLPIKSPGEMVTLASIVEKETGKADERPRVAGVFVNRLEKHMRLESDPTIVYGLVSARARSAAASRGPSSTSRRPTTPTSSTACRQDRSPTPARRRSRRWPTPRAARTSTLSPTEPAATPSPKRSTSTRRTSPIGGRSRRTSKTSSRRT